VPFWRPRGCVLWLDFLEPKGTTAYDKSGYDNHGTIYGATRVRALGRYGLSFDGIDDRVEVPHSNSLILDEVTVELLFKFHYLPAIWVTLITKGHYDLEDWFTWYDTHRHFSGQVVIENTRYMCRTGAILKEKVWYHGVWKRDLNGNQAIYINAELKVTAKDPGGTIDHAVDPVYVGTWEGLSQFFPGVIAFVRIYNRALTEREIRANYAYFFSRIKRAV